MSDTEDVPATAGAATDALTAKGANHYAWNTKTKERKAELEALGVSVAPKAVTVAAAAPAVATPGGAGSAWNSAGTWEDRDVSVKAVALLRECLPSVTHATTHGAGATPVRVHVTAVSACDGTATVVYSRGKAKPGYEVSLTASWVIRHGTGSGSGSADADAASTGGAGTADASPAVGDLAASGTLTIPDIADSEGSDMFGRFTVEGVDASAGTGIGLDAAGAKRLVQEATRGAIRAALREWAEKLKTL